MQNSSVQCPVDALHESLSSSVLGIVGLRVLSVTEPTGVKLPLPILYNERERER